MLRVWLTALHTEHCGVRCHVLEQEWHAFLQDVKDVNS